MDYETFKQKVQSMSGHEIVMNMISGLRNTHVQIQMCTYCSVVFTKSRSICFGCAATNSILEITGAKPNMEEIKKIISKLHAHRINYRLYDHIPVPLQNKCLSNLYGIKINDNSFIKEFERAIDYLRRGEIDSYNNIAEEQNFSTLPISKTSLPWLDDELWEEKILVYEQYAEWVKLQEKKSEPSEEAKPVKFEGALV